MSLNFALGSATSSLQAIQTRLGVAASNIANADTEGYTVKSATVASRVTGGTGTGVTVTGIASAVNANLLRSIVSATSADGEASVAAQYLRLVGDMLGSLSSEDGSGDTLAAGLASLASSLEALATTPESDTLKSQVALALDDAATELRETSDGVQSLRQQADAAIETAVQEINQALVAIDDLNDSITRAQSAGQSTADLEDQRMNAVRDLAALMDVTYFTDSTGAMKVYTSGGQPLVTAQVHLLGHDAASTVTSQSAYPSGLDGIWVNGIDITGDIRSGQLAALVELRDTTLPAVQTDLDSIAAGLIDTMNGLANTGSAAPPPQSLTGAATGLAGTDALSATGTLRVVVTDADGLAVTVADIDLSTLTTVDDLVGALNAVPGLGASLDADGRLTLAATASGTGVAVSGGDIGGKTVSSAFGLNDVLTGKGAEDIAVASALLADPTRLPVAVVNSDAALAAGDVAVSGGSGTLAQAMADAVADAGLGDSAATLVADVGSLLNQAEATATGKETALTALTDAFASRYGVNIDEETARISELESAYSASAQVLAAVQEMFDTLLQAVR